MNNLHYEVQLEEEIVEERINVKRKFKLEVKNGDESSNFEHRFKLEETNREFLKQKQELLVKLWIKLLVDSQASIIDIFLILMSSKSLSNVKNPVSARLICLGLNLFVHPLHNKIQD